MKLRKRERNVNTASSAVNCSSIGPSCSSSSSSSTASTSLTGNTCNRAGKRVTAIRGRSKAVKKILKEKNVPTQVDKVTDKSIDIDKMADVFQKCQHLQYHDECIKKLRELYHSTSHEDFCEKFRHFLRIILRSDAKSPFTKNCLVFIPKLINTLDNEKRGIELKEDETMDELAESIFGEEIFTEAHSSKACVLDYTMSEILMKEIFCTDTTVRKNVCLLVSRLLRSTKDIDDKIYKELQDALLSLAGDRNYLVRALAAFTLILFQDASKPDCPVVNAFKFHIGMDPAFQVRIASLKSVLVTPETLHFILKKIRDVKAVVRKTAFTKIAEHVPLKLLSTEQRLLILKEGLNDRHPNVRKVVEDNVLTSWLKNCDGDLVKLMTEIDVKNEPKLTKKVLDIFFGHFIETSDEQFGTRFHSVAHNFRESYLDDEKLLKEEHQTPEKVFTWQCLNTFIKKNEDEFIRRADKNFASKPIDQHNNSTLTGNTKLDEAETAVDDWADRTLNEDSNQAKDDSHIADYLFPELPHICQYLQKFVDSIDSSDKSTDEELIDKEFVYNQLVSILLLYDVCDEAQQNYILDMIRTIIFSPNLHLDFRDSISPIMKFIARRIFKDPNHLIEFTAECTSKVYNIAAEISVEETIMKSKTPEPSGSVEPTFDADYARLTMEIEEYRDQLDKAIAEQDFMTAQNMKNKLDELANQRERYQNIRLQQKSTQSQQIPPSQVPPTEPFNLNDHPETLLKCLQIFVGALEHGKFETANTLIFSHIDQIVLPSVLNIDGRTRTIAVKALGLSCLLSDSLFRQHCNLILQVLKYDSEIMTRVIALHSIFDCICKHGIEPLLRKTKTTTEERRSSRMRIEEDIANLTLQGGDPELLELSQMGSIGDAETQAEIHRSMMEEDDENDEEDEETDAETTIMDRERSRRFETLNSNSEQEMINSLVKLFTETLFNNGVDEMETAAFEGFAKLMILGVIYSPSLLSRFIITWYLPETKPRILQFLGVFLPIYVGSESKYVREDDHITVTGQTCLVDCFIDTLEVLFEAKYCLDKDPKDLRLFQYLPKLDKNCQYRQIDLKNVTSFMLNLIKPSHHKHLLSNLIHKMYSIVISNDQEFKFYEDFLIEYLLKACLRLSLDDIDDTVFNELRPVMIKLAVKVKSRMEGMRALSRKKAEKFIRSFLMFYKSFGRGELNASLSHASGELGDDTEGTGELDELEQMEEDLNLDPLGSMPELSDDDSKETDGKDKGDDEDEEENGGDDDEIADGIDSLSDVSETLRWSDIEENET